MAKTKPSKIDYTDMSNAVDLINVPSEETSPQDYQMDWGKWHGYYYNINAFLPSWIKRAFGVLEKASRLTRNDCNP